MEALRAAIPLRVGAVTLVPIERTEISSSAGDAGCWMGAVKEPFAIVVCDAGEIRVFAVDSSDLSLDELIEETPNLAAILAKISA
jgi:uncharacterized spore protein YtfJ